MTQQAMPKVEHVEFASKDPAATRKFAEKAFGLKFTDLGPQMGNYLMHGEGEGAGPTGMGIRALQPKEGAGTVAYITVQNIDAAIKGVEGAGGRILMGKTEIPGVGWSAVYWAPGDVVQGLYQKK